jgi:hypothetical protein
MGRELLLHVLLPMLGAALIYTFFRPVTLSFFAIFSGLRVMSELAAIRLLVSGFFSDLPFLVNYVLPDGIWTYSSTYLCFMVWDKDSNKLPGLLWCAFPITAALSIEVMQLYHFIAGTFCSYDIAFVVFFFLLATYNNRGRFL